MNGAAWLAIGTRLAEIRQRHNLSQRKVAELAGLTHSAVSTVEQNKVSPSVSTLHKLLAVYGLSLADFFAEEERARARPQVVIDPGERLQLGSQGVSLELIRRPDGEGTLGMLIESYQPGSSTGEQLTHPGEEIGTVLEGVLEIVSGGVSYRLEPGQSYVIDTSVPHRFSNPGERICRLISAHTPLTL